MSNLDSKFVDQEFSPSDASLKIPEITLPSSTMSGSKNGGIERGLRIEWRRPRQIIDNPRLFLNNVETTPIVQGLLGNCWFVAAVFSLAQHPQLIQTVIPSGTRQDYPANIAAETDDGRKHFRLWRFGEWTDVLVDDYLPVVNGRLVFAHSVNGRQFWPSLLEKAMAKVAGSYGALKSGTIAEALVDLTGGITENILLEKGSQKRHLKLLRTALQNGCLMTACISPTDDADPNIVRSDGLSKYHAYSVVTIDTADTVAIFDPIGYPVFGPGNCIYHNFWRQLAWLNFSRTFTHVAICHVAGPKWCLTTSPSQTIEELSLSGEWTLDQYNRRNNRAGGGPSLKTNLQNPQVLLTLPERSDNPVLISLSQKDCRRDTNFNYITIGINIIDIPQEPVTLRRLNQGNDLPKSLVISRFVNSRDVTVRLNNDAKRRRLVIIPCTFYPNIAMPFLLRVLAPSGTTLQLLA